MNASFNLSFGPKALTRVEVPNAVAAIALLNMNLRRFNGEAGTLIIVLPFCQSSVLFSELFSEKAALHMCRHRVSKSG